MLDDLRARPLRQDDASVQTVNDVDSLLLERRKLRHQRITLLGGNPESFHRAFFQILLRREDVHFSYVDILGKNRRQSLPGALIGDIFKARVGGVLHQQVDELAGRSSGNADLNRAGILLGVAHQSLHVVERRVAVTAEHGRRVGQPGDGSERVPGEVDAAGEIGGNHALVDGEQGAAVGLGFLGLLGALVAALPADVHHLQLRLEARAVDGVGDEPEDDVGVAACVPRNDQLRGAAGNVCRECREWRR